jgi:hypothetical protein
MLHEGSQFAVTDLFQRGLDGGGVGHRGICSRGSCRPPDILQVSIALQGGNWGIESKISKLLCYKEISSSQKDSQDIWKKSTLNASKNYVHGDSTTRL